MVLVNRPETFLPGKAWRAASETDTPPKSKLPTGRSGLVSCLDVWHARPWCRC